MDHAAVVDHTNVSSVDRRVLRRIDVHSRLGRGAYGIVWKGTERRGRQRVVALKKCFNAFASSSDAQRTYREVSYLRLLRGHANIVQLKNVIRAKNDLDIYLVFEHMETDLHAVIRANLLEEVHKKYVAYQLFKALKYLHSAGVVHRDVKPSNMLLNDTGRMKLCDFGLCRALSKGGGSCGQQQRREYYVATRWYRAPEILLGSHLCLPGLDVWAAACIVAEMYQRKPVLPGDSTADQLVKICNMLGRPTRADLKAMAVKPSDLDDTLRKTMAASEKPPPTQDNIAAASLEIKQGERQPQVGGASSLSSSSEEESSSSSATTPAPPWFLAAGGEEEEEENAELARRAVARMFVFDPRRRVTAADALADPWIACFSGTEPEPDYEAGAIELAIPDDSLRTASEYRDRLVLDLVSSKTSYSSSVHHRVLNNNNNNNNVHHSAHQLPQAAATRTPPGGPSCEEQQGPGENAQQGREDDDRTASTNPT